MQTKISTDHLRLYQSLFQTRTDVYAKFWTNFSNKKSGYAPVYSLTNKTDALSKHVIRSHLLGHKIVGVYPLFSDNTCCFLAIDFDKENWLDDSLLLIKVAANHKVPCYLEKSKSGNGGHIWFFFTEKVPAHKARSLGKYLLTKSNLSNLSAYDRMFPSQDEHSGKGFGNLICLPLQGKCLESGNTIFIDNDGLPYSNQWQYLSTIKTISLKQVDGILNRAIKITTSSTKKVRVGKNKNINNKAKEVRKVKTNSSPQTKLILNNQIFIPDIFLPDKLYKFLKSELNFLSPKHYELERRGYSTWQTPRFIKTIKIVDNGILVPAGFLTKIKQFANESGLKVNIEDKRLLLKSIVFPSKIKLRPGQQKITKDLLKHDRVILEAIPGFGKTMVGLYVMKRRKQPTIIIVHTKTLLHQWLKRIEEWFNLKDGEVGIIGDNKFKLGTKVTVASYQTLARRNLEEIKNNFGLVIIDECHHVPAKTLSKVVKQFPARYALGLTATAYRRDKLEKLMYFYISPTVIKAKSDLKKTKSKKSAIETKLITKRTGFEVSNSVNGSFNEIGKELITSSRRNQIIVRDIVCALQTRAKCLVLTERVDHCEILLSQVRKLTKGVHAAIASGKMTKKNRERIAQRMKQSQFQLLIATGKLIGEGFDWPELTHLFLAYPFSWKGKLTQYVGRVQRQFKGKDTAYVYDYLDYDVHMLKIMYFRRLRTYRELKLDRQKMANINYKKVDKNQMSLFRQ
ncbi:DEAD/DEAH box helicase [Patescibacteria group bacterium]|nr:DEAD/DEAH box helicase [Patescibacteria group bacterium]